MSVANTIKKIRSIRIMTTSCISSETLTQR